MPDHADVAGAVGAAAGSVRQRVMITVTQPAEGRFRVHLPDGPKDVKERDEALTLARHSASEIARNRALSAGATDIELAVTEDLNEVEIGDGKTLFIEGLIQAQASGAPSA